MNIIEAIQERRSVRNFNGEPLTDSQRVELMKFSSETFNPFGGHFTVRLKEFDLKNGYKPSTYGMIKGAVEFFIIAIDDDEKSALATGFCFEQVVLKAWQLGLGTCWIAATFKGTDFEKDESWPDGEKLRIICPVGVPVKKRLIEKIARFTLGSDNRKPYGELFFSEDFDKPLSPDNTYGKALAMLRLAPSSKNSQPWRVLVCGDAVHFFYVPKSPASVLDCGIGISHFYLTEESEGHTGTFFKENVAPATHDNWIYLTSYRRNK